MVWSPHLDDDTYQFIDSHYGIIFCRRHPNVCLHSIRIGPALLSGGGATTLTPIATFIYLAADKVNLFVLHIELMVGG